MRDTNSRRINQNVTSYLCVVELQGIIIFLLVVSFYQSFKDEHILVYVSLKVCFKQYYEIRLPFCRVFAVVI